MNGSAARVTIPLGTDLIGDQVLMADARGVRAVVGRRINPDPGDAVNATDLLMTRRLPMALKLCALTMPYTFDSPRYPAT